MPFATLTNILHYNTNQNLTLSEFVLTGLHCINFDPDNFVNFVHNDNNLTGLYVYPVLYVRERKTTIIAKNGNEHAAMKDCTTINTTQCKFWLHSLHGKFD